MLGGAVYRPDWVRLGTSSFRGCICGGEGGGRVLAEQGEENVIAVNVELVAGWIVGCVCQGRKEACASCGSARITGDGA
jgi:hypothetical protein